MPGIALPLADCLCAGIWDFFGWLEHLGVTIFPDSFGLSWVFFSFLVAAAAGVLLRLS